MSIEAALKELNIKSKVILSKELVGPPLLEILKVVCGTHDKEILKKLEEKFNCIYDEIGFKHGKPYNGVRELLQYTKEKGYRICLVTNKRLIPTEKILEHFNLRKYFLRIYAIDSLGSKFIDKTEAIARLLKEEVINPANAVYVGDRQEDYDAATNNKVKCLIVDWGYKQHNKVNKNSMQKKIPSISDLINIL